MVPERLELLEPSQAVLRAARALLRRNDRRDTGTFLAEGPQAVREALKVPHVVESVFFRWADVHDHVELLDERDQARERAEESAREQADMDSIGLMRARIGAIA